ncbi:MAG: hypothetical protein O3A63_17725, partial [Proteobacteria bacterium]|nr:hypothetical protein [Pseudomonadota bacterium]
MGAPSRWALPGLVVFGLLAGCTGSSDRKKEEGQDAALNAPSVSFSASPSQVESGESTTLVWSSSDAVSCSASGGWSGEFDPDGSVVTGAITASTTFTLTCHGDGGSSTSQVSV